MGLVCVMTNSDGGEFLIQELLRGVAKEYSWPDFSLSSARREN